MGFGFPKGIQPFKVVCLFFTDRHPIYVLIQIAVSHLTSSRPA